MDWFHDNFHGQIYQLYTKNIKGCILKINCNLFRHEPQTSLISDSRSLEFYTDFSKSFITEASVAMKLVILWVWELTRCNLRLLYNQFLIFTKVNYPRRHMTTVSIFSMLTSLERNKYSIKWTPSNLFLSSLPWQWDVYFQVFSDNQCQKPP